MDKNESARYQLSVEMLGLLYPTHLQELANLTNQTPEKVEGIINYICETRPGRNKHIVLDDLLTFHRIADAEKPSA